MHFYVLWDYLCGQPQFKSTPSEKGETTHAASASVCASFAANCTIKGRSAKKQTNVTMIGVITEQKAVPVTQRKVKGCLASNKSHWGSRKSLWVNRIISPITNFVGTVARFTPFEQLNVFLSGNVYGKWEKSFMENVNVVQKNVHDFIWFEKVH